MARAAMSPLLDSNPTQRVCTLMAKIEGGEHGDAGRVREWLARAVNAPRDPAWTADGVVSQTWSPVSPITGQLDAFQWRVPVENAEPRDQEAILGKLEELVALGAGTATAPVPQSISLAPKAQSQAVPKARNAEDADVVDVRTPVAPTVTVPVAAKPTATKPVEAAPVAVARPVATMRAAGSATASATPIKSATGQPTPSAQVPPMAEGVLRTVRASSGPTGLQAAVYHAPDDPGLDEPLLGDGTRPYMVPYTRPTKQRR